MKKKKKKRHKKEIVEEKRMIKRYLDCQEDSEYRRLDSLAVRRR